MQIWQGGGDGSDVAKIENIAVQCEKTFIKVEVKFDRPFSGMIYSKGHYSDQGCYISQIAELILNPPPKFNRAVHQILQYAALTSSVLV